MLKKHSSTLTQYSKKTGTEEREQAKTCPINQKIPRYIPKQGEAQKRVPPPKQKQTPKSLPNSEFQIPNSEILYRSTPTKNPKPKISHAQLHLPPTQNPKPKSAQ